MNGKPKAPASPKKPIPLPEEDDGPSEDEVISDLIQDDFVQALAAGNAAGAANALRKLDALPRYMLEILADLFEGDPELADLYPYRLKLVPRRRGRPPVDRLTKEGKEQAIARALHFAVGKFGKMEAAIAHVQHQHAALKGKKLSKSTILKCYSRHKNLFSNEQSP